MEPCSILVVTSLLIDLHFTYWDFSLILVPRDNGSWLMLIVFINIWVDRRIGPLGSSVRLQWLKGSSSIHMQCTTLSSRYFIQSCNMEGMHSISLIQGLLIRNLYYYSPSITWNHAWIVLDPTKIGKIMLPNVLHNWLLKSHRIRMGVLRCDKARIIFSNDDE